MRLRFLLVALLLAGLAAACVWNSDTLGFEARAMPETLDAMIGRMKVLPDIHYEKRLERVRKEWKKTPKKLDLYDDAAMSADWLGNHSEARLWMARKSVQLAKTPDKEHQYRYHANLGTIAAHEWTKTRDPKRLALLDEALLHLRKGIEINPDAHFGREIVQVEVIDLIRAFEKSGPDPKFSVAKEWDQRVDKIGEEKTVKGLIGMMAMGAGADSPDMVVLLARAISPGYDGLQMVANHRRKDLIASGRTQILPLTIDLPRIPQMIAPVQDAYQLLSKDAAEYRKSYTTFVEAEIGKGRHADTDPDFWNRWQEPIKLDLLRPDVRETLARRHSPQVNWLPILLLGLFGIVVFIGIGVAVFRVVVKSSHSNS